MHARRLAIAAPILAIFVVAAGAAAQQNENSRVTLPQIVKMVRPKGPRNAKVEFECVVLADGTVQIVKILKTSDPKLNDTATDAMKQWLFKPATRDGKPVPVTISVELDFRQQ